MQMKKPPQITLRIKISRQTLCVLEGDKVRKTYKVSTSKYGTGNKDGSNKTPLGLHSISNTIGRNARSGSIFKRRRNIKKIARVNKGCGDLISSRILRLEGLQAYVNKGKNIDSFKRCIYIHGTPEERLIGKPVSHGCIRMKNRDIIDLFQRVKRGVVVNIIK